MFRREVGGEVFRFNVYGLWGSGNVVTERELIPTDTNTAYSMWDGHPLFGPGTESIEKVPILLDDLQLGVVLERYAFLEGDNCLVWTGEEELGIDCDTSCEHFGAVCGDDKVESCLLDCEGWPRAISECFGNIRTCAEQVYCNAEDWEHMQTETTTTP